MNLEWFATIPGILISGGVFLLIVALIIFIATSSKKGKKENNTVENIEDTNKMVSDSINGENMAISNQTSIVDFNNSQVNTNAVGDLTGTVDSTVNNMPPIDNSISIGNIDPSPTVSEGITPSIDSNNITSVNVNSYSEPSLTTPSMEPVNNMETISTPNPVEQAQQPVVTPQVAEVSPVIDVAPSIEPAVQSSGTIYGGADPLSNINLNVSENNQIYGGADPLENTQILPTNEISSVSQSVQQPVVNTPAAAPEIAPVNPAPVEPVAPVTPEIVPVNPEQNTVDVIPSITPEVKPAVETNNDVSPAVTPIQ